MESDVKFVSGRDSLEASMRGMWRGKLENGMGVLGSKKRLREDFEECYETLLWRHMSMTPPSMGWCDHRNVSLLPPPSDPPCWLNYWNSKLFNNNSPRWSTFWYPTACFWVSRFVFLRLLCTQSSIDDGKCSCYGLRRRLYVIFPTQKKRDESSSRLLQHN